MKNIWQLQEAKNKFSEVINEAIKHGPQTIIRDYIETVVVLSLKDFRKMKQKEGKLSDFFKFSPLSGLNLDIERNRDYSRNIEL